jgi:type I restriction enzyme S subunit
MSYQKQRLADISTMKTGKLNSNAAVVGGMYPFFTCAQETYWIDKPAFNTEAVILGGNNANGIFPLKYYNGEFNAYQRTYIFETKDADTLNIRYLYYALRPALSQFQAASIGAATQYLTKPILDNFKVSLPEIDQQDKIVSILSSYDDLIENNKRRIELLEESARQLYKEWFVRFRFPGHEHVKIVNGVPQGWKVTDFGDVAKISKGKNITKESSIEGSVPVVAGGLSPAYYHNSSNTECPVITVSASGANAGYVNLYHEKIWASDCSYIERSDKLPIYYIYLLLKYRQNEITGMQKGAAQPHVYPKDLMRLVVCLPPDKLILQSSEYISDNFKSIQNLQNQNKFLSKARDLLLPKLMSGEIAV